MKMNMRHAHEHPYPNPHENSLVAPAVKGNKSYFPVLTIIVPHTTKQGKDIWRYCYGTYFILITQQSISKYYLKSIGMLVIKQFGL